MNYMGDEEDQRYLEGLNHLEREKVIDRRRRHREQLIKEEMLMKQMGGRRESDFGELKKPMFAELKEDSKDFVSNKKVKADKRASIVPARDSKTINPTEDMAKLNQICMKRSAILKLIDHFGFEAAVKDCLIKVSLGAMSEDNLSQYKIGLIQGVISMPAVPYSLEGTNMDRYLRVLFENGVENDVAILNISNKEIDEHEAFKLLTDLKRSGGNPLDKTWIDKKQADLEGFLNKRLALEDIIKIKERRLENIRANESRNPWSEKRLLEEHLHHIEFQNFKEYDDERYNKIQELRSELAQINARIASEKHAEGELGSAKDKFDKFIDYKSVGNEERFLFLRNEANPLNMWTIEKQHL